MVSEASPSGLNNLPAQGEQKTVQEMRQEVRRMKIIEGINKGIRQKKLLAEYADCSLPTVYKDLKAIDEEFGRMGAALAGRRDQEKWIALSRYEGVIEAISDIMWNTEVPAEVRLKAGSQIRSTVDSIAKLAGLNAPTKTSLTNPDGDEEFGKIPEEFKLRALKARKEAERIAAEDEENTVVGEVVEDDETDDRGTSQEGNEDAT